MKLPALLQGPRRLLFLRLASSGFLEAAGVLVTAVLVQQIFDEIILAPGAESGVLLAYLGGGLLLVGSLIALLKWQQRVDAEALGQHYVHQVRQVMFEQLARISARTLEQRGKGGILLRFIGDLTALRQWISLGFVRLALSSIILLGTLLALAFIDWTMSGLIAVALLLGGLASFLLGKPLERAIREARKRRAYLASNISEKVSQTAVMQASGQAQRESNRVQRQSSRLKDAMLQRAFWSGSLRAVSDGTARLATALALVIGALQVLGHGTTPGTVVGAMAVIGMLTPNVRQLGRVHEYWRNAAVAKDKLAGFLRLERSTRRRGKGLFLKKGPGQIVFDNVSLQGVLRRITVSAEGGEKIALQGPNGSGKTTLLWLAARLLHPDEGSICLDGHDIAGLSLKSLSRSVAMVSADLPLYRGSLRRNISYRHPQATDDEIQTIIEVCALKGVIDRLPGGLQGRISERGMNLSTGERQRVALARALIGNPSVLLLDEAEVNFDAEARRVYRHVLERFSGTVLMTTHNLIPFEGLSQVWNLKNGRLFPQDATPFGTPLNSESSMPRVVEG